MLRTRLIASMIAMSSLAACGKSTNETGALPEDRVPATNAPAVTYKPGPQSPEKDTSLTAKMTGPVRISYRIIGTPVVGQPVAVDLRVTSALESPSITLDYRINDASALQLAKSQPASFSLSANDLERGGVQQVRVIPMREGRLYLNVSASIETERGSMSTVTAIPIQVGDAPRVLERNGETQTDAEGNLIKVHKGFKDNQRASLEKEIKQALLAR